MDRPKQTREIALECVPRLVKARAELALDPKSDSLLDHIDGKRTVQRLLDVSGMPPLDVVVVLDRLVDLGVLVLT